MATSEQVPDGPIWRLLLGLGTLFVIVGALELVSLWIPPEFAVEGWRFGTATAFLDTFPLLGLGVVFLLAAVVALGHRRTTRALAVVCVVLAVCVCLAAVLYLSILPAVLRIAKDPAVRGHIIEGTVKAGLQGLLYPTVLILLSVVAWRTTRPRSRGRR